MKRFLGFLEVVTNKHINQVRWFATLFAAGLLAAGSLNLPDAHAGTVFFDDFEDMNLEGWTQSNSGGSATFNVVERDSSNRAHVRHVSNTSTGDQSSLSMTFNYNATDIVSFEIEALAFLSQWTYRIRHGLAGVQVSFLNIFNVPLGSAGLFNVTSTSLLGPNDLSIPSTQQNYSATMAEFAALAGLDETDPIAKMSLSFLARGYFSGGPGIYPNLRSGGDVWFDNVSVGPVPVFATVNPNYYDFGIIEILCVASNSFIVENTSSKRLEISSVLITGDNSDEFYIQNDNCSAKPLKPAETCTFEVSLEPTSYGSKDAELTISFTNSGLFPIVVPLTGLVTKICECDLNQDHSCNIQDYQAFIQKWGATDCKDPDFECPCDLNSDGKCNILDYQLFIQDWGRKDCPVSPKS